MKYQKTLLFEINCNGENEKVKSKKDRQQKDGVSLSSVGLAGESESTMAGG